MSFVGCSWPNGIVYVYIRVSTTVGDVCFYHFVTETRSFIWSINVGRSALSVTTRCPMCHLLSLNISGLFQLWCFCRLFWVVFPLLLYLSSYLFFHMWHRFSGQLRETKEGICLFEQKGCRNVSLQRAGNNNGRAAQ